MVGIDGQDTSAALLWAKFARVEPLCSCTLFCLGDTLCVRYKIGSNGVDVALKNENRWMATEE